MPTINTDGTCLCGIQAHTCTYHKPEPNPYATLTKRFGFGPVPGTLTVEEAADLAQCLSVNSGTTIKLDDVELAARDEYAFLREEASDSYICRVFYYCRAPRYNANFTF